MTISLESASNKDVNVTSSIDLNFSSFNTEESIAISTVEDLLIESDEVFRVNLSTSSSNVEINGGITTVTILDNDGKCVLHGLN